MLKDFKSYVPFVQEVLPSFLKEGDSKLIEFLELYYQWCEEQGNVQEVLFKLDNSNYDIQVDAFYQQFKSEILPFFPADVEVDESLLARSAREFYKTKGTPDGARVLFRLLFNEEIELDFPGERVIRPSTSDYSIRTALRVVEPEFNLERESELFSTAGRIAAVVVPSFVMEISEEAFLPTQILYREDGSYAAIVQSYNRGTGVLGLRSISGVISEGDVLRNSVDPNIGESLTVSAVSGLIPTGSKLTIEKVARIGSGGIYSFIVSNIQGDVSDSTLQYMVDVGGKLVTFAAETNVNGISRESKGVGFIAESEFELTPHDLLENAPEFTPARLKIKDISIGTSIRVESDVLDGTNTEPFSEFIVYRDSSLLDGLPSVDVAAPAGGITLNAIGSVRVSRAFAGDKRNSYYFEIVDSYFDTAYIEATNVSGELRYGTVFESGDSKFSIVGYFPHSKSKHNLVVNRIEGDITTGQYSSESSSTTFDVESLEGVKLLSPVETTLENVRSLSVPGNPNSFYTSSLSQNGNSVVTNFSEVAGQVDAIQVVEPGTGFPQSLTGRRFGILQNNQGDVTVFNSDELDILKFAQGKETLTPEEQQVVDKAELAGLIDRDYNRVAVFRAWISTVFEEGGVFVTEKGQPSGDNVIRDGLRFQDFSYTIKSGTSILQWREVVRKLSHLSGNFLSGEISSTSVIQETATTDSLKLFSRRRPEGINFNNPDNASSSNFLEHVISIRTGEPNLINDLTGNPKNASTQVIPVALNTKRSSYVEFLPDRDLVAIIYPFADYPIADYKDYTFPEMTTRNQDVLKRYYRVAESYTTVSSAE